MWTVGGQNKPSEECIFSIINELLVSINLIIIRIIDNETIVSSSSTSLCPFPPTQRVEMASEFAVSEVFSHKKPHSGTGSRAVQLQSSDQLRDHDDAYSEGRSAHEKKNRAVSRGVLPIWKSVEAMQRQAKQ